MYEFFNTLLATIDVALCNLVDAVYNLIIYLASAQLFNADVIKEFGTRIYILVGIFMLLKLSFSLISYIVSPDQMEKTGGKLVANVAISLALIVSTPWIFSKIYQLQSALLMDNTIGNVILGMSMGDNGEAMKGNVSYSLTYGVGSVFTRPKDPECFNAVTSNQVTNDSEICGDLKEVAMLVQDNKDITYYLEDEYLNLKKDGDLLIEHTIFLSWLPYIVVIVVLLGFAINIVIRTVKLGLLQLIAPIPILMNIDPKAAKDSPLGKWAKECLSTFLSLFGYLASLYFGIMIIQMIMLSNISYMGGVKQPTGVMNAFVNFFLIIGTLYFTKKIPDLISKIFGISLSSSLGGGFMKAVGLGAVGGLVGGAIGSAGSMGAAFSTARDLGKGKGRAALSALGAGFTGGARGAASNFKWDGKAGSLAKNPKQAGGKIARNMMLRDSTKPGDRIGSRFRNAVGAQQKIETLDQQLSQHEQVTNSYDEWKKVAEGKIAIHDAMKSAQANIDAAKASGNARRIIDAQRDYDNNKKILLQQWATNTGEYANGGGGKEYTDAVLASVQQVVSDSGLGYTVGDIDELKAASREAENYVRVQKASQEYKDAKDISDARKAGLMDSHIK